MKNGIIITALDVGSSKVTAIIAVVNSNGEIEIKGKGESPSVGIEAGMIKDIKSVSKSIKVALEQAEDNADLEAQNIFVSITGKSVKSQNIIGRASVVGTQNQPNEISKDHVKASKEQAENTVHQYGVENYEIVHSIHQFFEVDGKKEIIDPVNMSGYHLTAFIHLIMMESGARKNIIKAIELAGFKVRETVSAALASGMSVLNKDEKKLGSILLDIGAGTCDVSVFYKDSIRFSTVIDLGGENVTRDIAIGLRTPIDYAEQLKKSEGNAVAVNVSTTDTIEVKRIGEDKSDLKSKMLIAQIIQARMEYTLGEVYKELLKFQQFDAMAAGIVLTGGGSQLRDLPELAHTVFNKPIRIGAPLMNNFMGDKEAIRKTELSTAAGLLIYAKEAVYENTGSIDEKMAIDNFKGFFRNFLKKLKEFI